jgi:signal peptidase I
MGAKIRIGSLAVLLLITLALTPFRILKISGQSMEPTLRNGETYLLDQFYWKGGGVRRDDIVVVRHEEEKWVKRLVGMPGDRLQITYRPDGSISDIANLTVNPGWERQEPDTVLRAVEPDEIFVIGDNLNRSSDSTNQGTGAFKLRDIVGVVRTLTLVRSFPFPGRR